MPRRCAVGARAITSVGWTRPRNWVTRSSATVTVSSRVAPSTPSGRWTSARTCASSSGRLLRSFAERRRESSFVHGFTDRSFSAASTFAFVYVYGPSKMSSCGGPPPQAESAAMSSSRTGRRRTTAIVPFLQVDRHRAARPRPLLAAQNLYEGGRRPRELPPGIDGDLADQRRCESQQGPLDARKHDVVRHERRTDPRRRQPRSTFRLRGPDRPARAEPRATADLLQDSGQAVVRVVEHPLAVCELFEPNRLTRGQWVARRSNDDELLPRHLLQRALPRSERQWADREVGDPRLDRLLEQRAVPELLEPDADVRIALVPEADVSRQQADGHREDGRDLELARFECECSARGAPSALDRTHGCAGLRQQRASGRCERDTARQALEHRSVDVGLERTDVLRERGLRDPDPAGRTRERPFLDNGDEARELPDIHRQILYLRLSTATCTIDRHREDSPQCVRPGSTTSALRRSTWRSPRGSMKTSSRWSESRRRRSSRRSSGSASETLSSISSSRRARGRSGITSGSPSTTSTPPTRQ